MTREIVQSDLELAKKLIWARCEDGGIIAWLRFRGVGPEQASQLVSGLRQGKLIKPATPCVAWQSRRSARTALSLTGQITCSTGHHRHRHHSRWRKPFARVRKALFPATATAIACIGLLSFCYLAQVIWAEISQPLPLKTQNWMKRVMIYQQGLEDPISDNLKALPSKP